MKTKYLLKECLKFKCLFCNKQIYIKNIKLNFETSEECIFTINNVKILSEDNDYLTLSAKVIEEFVFKHREKICKFPCEMRINKNTLITDQFEFTTESYSGNETEYINAKLYLVSNACLCKNSNYKKEFKFDIKKSNLDLNIISIIENNRSISYDNSQNIISLIGFQQSDIENITMTKFMNKFNTEDKIKDFLILS